MNHITVLINETVDLLNINPDGRYIDATLGSGGHSLEILKKLGDQGELIAVDLDEDTASVVFNEKFKGIVNFKYIHENFANIGDIFEKDTLDGVIADLGWSTDQLGELQGLSHQSDLDLLDMRFDKNLSVKASDLLNALGESELENLFVRYADISMTKSRRLAKEIKEYRKYNKLLTVGDFNKLLTQLRLSDVSMMSKIYQALRIAVNMEFDNLKRLIHGSIRNLKKGGRLLIITFHSGEEKVVEAEVAKLNKRRKAEFYLGDKYLKPSLDELKNNLKARSAKLWVIEKI